MRRSRAGLATGPGHGLGYDVQRSCRPLHGAGVGEQVEQQQGGQHAAAVTQGSVGGALPQALAARVSVF